MSICNWINLDSKHRVYYNKAITIGFDSMLRRYHVREKDIGKIGCIRGKTIAVWSWGISHKRKLSLPTSWQSKKLTAKASEVEC